MEFCSGTLLYLHDERGETGREHFRMNVAGGFRTLSAVCEMDEDGLTRHVVYTVDAAWRPVECFIRLSVKDAFMGSSLFRFPGSVVECEAQLSGLGRISQRLELPEPPQTFVCHPLTADGMQPAVYDAEKGGKQRIFSANSSTLPNGGSGPLAGAKYKFLEGFGSERVVVPAGTFDCERFEISWGDGRPPLQLWVIPKGFILARLRWDFLNSQYDLAELKHA